MKVFISSVVGGMEAEREAARRAAASLGHEVRGSEDFPASDLTPEQACLAGVRWADVIVLLLGARYGALQPGGLSATHTEYREARERRQVLAFVQDDVAREEPENRFVEEVEGWASGRITAHFRGPEEMRDAVTRALHELEFSMRAGPSDHADLSSRAHALLPTEHHPRNPTMSVVVVGGPRQVVIRPAELEDPELERDVLREALLGTTSVLTPAQGTRSRVEPTALILEQDDASVLVDEMGSVRVVQPVLGRGRTEGLPALLEEDVRERLTRSLAFAARILDRIDPLARVSEVMPVAAIHGAQHTPWRTRAEHAASPNSVSIPMRREDGVVVTLPQPVIARPALARQAEQIVSDLTALLRRRLTA